MTAIEAKALRDAIREKELQKIEDKATTLRCSIDAAIKSEASKGHSFLVIKKPETEVWVRVRSSLRIDGYIIDSNGRKNATIRW